MATNQIIITRGAIAEELKRESSLLSVNLDDKNGVSMYDRIFVDNDTILYGAVTNAVGNLTREARKFISQHNYNSEFESYNWTLRKVAPDELDRDFLDYIVCFTMHEWYAKSLNNSGQSDTFGTRATNAMHTILKKLYHKPSPM